MQEKIYQLTLEQLQDREFFENVLVKDNSNSYYWSSEWDVELYIKLAQLGFISTSYKTKEGLVLLPELQLDYSILDFKNLHISKKVQKLLKSDRYRLTFNTHLEEILQAISKQHQHNWLEGEYIELLKKLAVIKRNDFEFVTVGLVHRDDATLVAGEVGYKIANTYTSLSGFSSREKSYDSCGTLQLVKLAQHLEARGFDFWSLGHPHMEYKKKLGAKTYSREAFLKRWQKSVEKL